MKPPVNIEVLMEEWSKDAGYDETEPQKAVANIPNFTYPVLAPLFVLDQNSVVVVFAYSISALCIAYVSVKLSKHLIGTP